MKKISVKSIYLILIISIGLIFLGVGSTYAVFTASSEIENPITFSSNLTYNSDIVETIDVTLEPGEEKYITLDISNNTGSTINYVAWYLNNVDNVYFRPDPEQSYWTSGTLTSLEYFPLGVSMKNYNDSAVTVTLGVSSSTNSVVLGSNMKELAENKVDVNLSSLINTLYKNNPKTTVLNNNITYNYATSVSLMNDRLGGTTTSLDGGNIRYYGKDPNNYIYFNCSDYNNQSSSTCEIWRIIGVFDGKVKIINSKSIGDYPWNNTNVNDWTEASLMKLLNPDYEDESIGGSLYYYGESGNCYVGSGNYAKTCNFTSGSITPGLKNDATRNRIAEVTWNIGGFSSSAVSSSGAYSYERGSTTYQNSRPTTWTGKVALMYPSDYGYATDFNKCSSSLSNYSNSTDNYACRSNDWLFNSTITWLLTPDSLNSDNAWFVYSNGYVTNNIYIYGAEAVRPTLYLNANEVIESGLGVSNNPYRLKA